MKYAFSRSVADLRPVRDGNVRRSGWFDLFHRAQCASREMDGNDSGQNRETCGHAHSAFGRVDSFDARCKNVRLGGTLFAKANSVAKERTCESSNSSRLVRRF